MNDALPLVRELVEVMDCLTKSASAQLDIGETGVRALRIIEREPGIKPMDLAARLAHTTGGTTTTLDVLERYRLARRIRNPLDRRTKVLSLTTDGERLVRAVYGNVDREVGGYLRERTTADREVIAAFLRFTIATVNATLNAGVR